MKKFLLLLFLPFAAGVSAQPYTLLSADPQGDNTVSFLPDAMALHYKMSVAQDSLWFRVETFTAVDPNGDVGMMFGLDTNLVTTDGLAWNGNNTSMNYDVAVVVFQNSMSPNYYGFLYSGSGSTQIPLVVQRPDSFTFDIALRLSDADPDGNFHLLFGFGAFDILSTRSVYDDIPNTGFLSVPAPSPVIDFKHRELRPWPNPARSIVHIPWEGPGSVAVQGVLSDVMGKEVRTWILTGETPSFDVSDLPPGMYFLQINEPQPQRVRFMIR